MRSRYICVEGPIGAGKSEFCYALKQRIHAQLVEDAPNPFLPSFYQDMEKYAFQVQLFFLLSRFQQQQQILQRELFSNYLICDYVFQKDRLFASLTLNSHEMALYEKVYSLLKGQIPKPDVIVYLQANADILHKRISKKNEELSMFIPKSYLSDVVQAYQDFFLHYDQETPIIVCSSEQVNFYEDEKNMDLLLRKIAEVDQGVHYLHIQEG